MVTAQLNAPSAKEIHDLRREMRLTLEDFGYVAGCSYYTVHRWESGKTPDISDKNAQVLLRVKAAWKRLGVGEKLRLISIDDKTARRVAMRKALNPDVAMRKVNPES